MMVSLRLVYLAANDGLIKVGVVASRLVYLMMVSLRLVYLATNDGLIKVGVSSN